jgi:hypothetical protein
MFKRLFGEIFLVGILSVLVRLFGLGLARMGLEEINRYGHSGLMGRHIFGT